MIKLKKISIGLMLVFFMFSCRSFVLQTGSLLVKKTARIKNLCEITTIRIRDSLQVNYEIIMGYKRMIEKEREKIEDDTISSFLKDFDIEIKKIKLTPLVEKIWNKGDSIGIFFYYEPCLGGFSEKILFSTKKMENFKKELDPGIFHGCDILGRKKLMYYGIHIPLSRRLVILVDEQGISKILLPLPGSISEINVFLQKHKVSGLKRRYLLIKLRLISFGQREPVEVVPAF